MPKAPRNAVTLLRRAKYQHTCTAKCTSKRHWCAFGSLTGCQHSTEQASNITTHELRIHTDMRYPCDVPGCDFTWADPSARTNHMKNVHKHAPRPRRTRRKNARTSCGNSKMAQDYEDQLWPKALPSYERGVSVSTEGSSDYSDYPASDYSAHSRQTTPFSASSSRSSSPSDNDADIFTQCRDLDDALSAMLPSLQSTTRNQVIEPSYTGRFRYSRPAPLDFDYATSFYGPVDAYLDSMPTDAACFEPFFDNSSFDTFASALSSELQWPKRHESSASYPDAAVQASEVVEPLWFDDFFL